MNIRYERAAASTLKRLSRFERERIEAALAKLPAGDVRPLTGRSGYRLRVGAWRVLFREEAQGVVVELVRRRGDVYRR